MKQQKDMDQLAIAANQHIKEQKYWINQLSGPITKCVFPYNHIKPDSNDVHLSEEAFCIPSDIFEKLLKLSRGSDHTLHIILTAALNVLLAKYTDDTTIIIGTPIYRPETTTHFINTVLPIKTQLEEGNTFKILLIAVRELVRKAVENQNYPIEILIEQLGLSFKENDFPLFDTALVLENIQDPAHIEHLPINTIFSFNRTTDEILGKLTYNSDLYESDSIKRLIGHFQNCLQVAITDHDLYIYEIDLLSDREREQILIEFNCTQADYPTGTTIHQLFQQQAEKSSEQTAIINFDGTQSMSFGQLNKRSDALATALCQMGVSPNTVVVIMVERSMEFFIAVMAILKAGGAYLAIDPNYPQDRIDFLLADSGATIMLTEQKYLDLSLPDIGNKKALKFNGTIVRLKDETLYQHKPTENDRLQAASPENLVYVIYTSGSTGRPKGVMIRHYSLINRLKWMQKQFPLGQEDTILHKTPFNFDVSVWEIFWWGLEGAKVCLLEPGGEKDPSAIVEAIEKNKITVMHFVPSMLNAFLEYMKSSIDIKRLFSLKHVIASGEELLPGQVRLFDELLSQKNNTRLANLYGPAEATVDVSFFDCPTKKDFQEIPIGKPIDNINLFVVSKDNHLQPIGLTGELFISGIGLAMGYLNRPELTAEKFLPNIFATEVGIKNKDEFMYRTGDLACWLPDGNIRYIGRIDNQVKIRGARIELGEIESQLLACEGIKEAVVLARKNKNGDVYLCAYFVATKIFEPSELDEYLGEKLPDYMIPHYYVPLEKLPLNPSGKVDRKQLKEPDTLIGEEYIAPRNKTEAQMIEIWKNVLGVEIIGITNNFFRIGGDSIKAIKLISTINNQLGADLRMTDVYKHQTVQALVGRSNKKYVDLTYESIRRLAHEEALREIEEFKTRIMEGIGNKKILEDIEDIFPMSDIEKGMVYYSYKYNEDAFYHDQSILQFSVEKFDIQCMKKAIALLITKHSTLRTAFLTKHFAHIIYKYKESFVDKIVYQDLSAMMKNTQESYIIKYMEGSRKKPFELSKPPLWRISFFKVSPENIALLWEVHHAVIDGWSYASFLAELNNTYLQLRREPDYVPEMLKCQYKDFIVDHLAEKKNKTVRDYWKDELTDYKRWSLPKPSGKRELKTISKQLGIEFREKLEAVAYRNGTSIKHLCLAAYMYTLYMLSYGNDITASLVSHIRPGQEDGEKLLGCFLNTIPFRLKIPSRITCKELVGLIDKKVFELKNNEKLSLMEILNIIGEKTGDVNPVADTLFGYIDFHVLREIISAGPRAPTMDVLELKNYERTNYLFEFQVDTLDKFFIKCHYSTEFIEDYLAENACQYFVEVLNKFIDQMEGMIEKDDILSEDEKKQIQFQFSTSLSDFPRDKTIHELFQEQVERSRDSIALIGPSINRTKELSHNVHDSSIQITYQELNNQSDRLAYLLREKGVYPDTIVGIKMERSIGMILGILGVLKSGGAYLPIDPDYPQERIDFMLKDSGAEMVLTHEFINSATILPAPPAPLKPLTQPHHLGYIIYTSGSTGKPKGVLTTHCNITRVVKNTNYIDITHFDRILQLSNYAFDGSVFDIFGALLNSAALIMISREDVLALNRMSTIIKREGVTVFFITTALFNTLVELEIGCFDHIRKVLFGGERVSVAHSRKAIDYMGKNRVIHVYGPTETTVYATYYFIDTIDDYAVTIPIGKPISNSTIYIFDKNLKPSPIGVSGEIYIGGDGVARGYLNHPELTAAKFVYLAKESYALKKFGNENSPLYRTGDFARWLPDGNIEFLGRIDDQVKVRGFRIELGEIEYHLSKHPDIKEVVVTVKSAGEPKSVGEKGNENLLYAYLVSEKEFSISELKTYLASILPPHMIPSHFIRLDKIPLTPNGKIDIKSLDSLGTSFGTGEDFIAPQNDTEKKIASLWKETLRLAKVGINDNFFDLGGSSLDVIKLSAKLNETYNINESIMVMFRYPTIHSYANYLRKRTEDAEMPVVSQNTAPYTTLTSEKVKESRIDQRNRRRGKSNVNN